MLIEALESLAHAEIADRHDVRPRQREHQEHLRRPHADAFDRCQVLDDRIVGHAVELAEVRNGAVERLGGEVLQRRRLGARQAGAPQHVERRGGNGLRRQHPAERRDQPRLDGRRRLPRQLLIDHGVRQQRERRAAAMDRHRIGPVPLDRAAQYRIGLGQRADRRLRVDRAGFIGSAQRHPRQNGFAISCRMSDSVNARSRRSRSPNCASRRRSYARRRHRRSVPTIAGTPNRPFHPPRNQGAPQPARHPRYSAAKRRKI